MPGDALTPLQYEMLKAGKFHVDSWTSPRGRAAAAQLEALGLLRSFEGGDSQYTAINYTITDAGRICLTEETPHG